MKKVAMYVNTYVGVRDVEIGKEQDTVREIVRPSGPARKTCSLCQ